MPHKNTTRKTIWSLAAQKMEALFRNKSNMAPRGENFLILFDKNENIAPFAVIYQ